MKLCVTIIWIFWSWVCVIRFISLYSAERLYSAVVDVCSEIPKNQLWRWRQFPGWYVGHQWGRHPDRSWCWDQYVWDNSLLQCCQWNNTLLASAHQYRKTTDCRHSLSPIGYCFADCYARCSTPTGVASISCVSSTVATCVWLVGHWGLL